MDIYGNVYHVWNWPDIGSICLIIVELWTNYIYIYGLVVHSKTEEIIASRFSVTRKGEYIESSQNGIWSWVEVSKLSIQVHIIYTDTFLSSTSLGPWMNLVPWSEVSLVQAEVAVETSWQDILLLSLQYIHWFMMW